MDIKMNTECAISNRLKEYLQGLAQTEETGILKEMMVTHAINKVELNLDPNKATISFFGSEFGNREAFARSFVEATGLNGIANKIEYNSLPVNGAGDQIFDCTQIVATFAI